MARRPSARRRDPRLSDGTDVSLIADTAHIMFEGLLGSTIPRDRPFAEIVRFLIDMLVAAAPQTQRRRARRGKATAARPDA